MIKLRECSFGGLMKWDDLRYILAVAREGTIAKGARRLHVDPTTVSRRLKALEQSAGSALFEKLKHGAVLSAAGEEMVRAAEAMEQLAHNLDAKIHGLDARLEGPLRVTSMHSVLQHFLPDFGEFERRYPGIELELTSTMSVANLTQRESDVAIRVATEVPGHLIGRKHAELFFAIYGSHELVERIGPDAAYGDFPWLGWDASVGGSTDRWLEANAPGRTFEMRVNTMPLMNRALEVGLGVTILNVLDGDTNPRLRRIGPYLEGGLHLWLLAHPKARASARITAFLRFIRERIERDKDLIEGRRPQPPR